MNIYEYKEEALKIRKVVSKGFGILIEPGSGQERDWDGNPYTFRVTVFSSSGVQVACKEGHKIGLSLGEALANIGDLVN